MFTGFLSLYCPFGSWIQSFSASCYLDPGCQPLWFLNSLDLGILRLCYSWIHCSQAFSAFVVSELTDPGIFHLCCSSDWFSLLCTKRLKIMKKVFSKGKRNNVWTDIDWKLIFESRKKKSKDPVCSKEKERMYQLKSHSLDQFFLCLFWKIFFEKMPLSYLLNKLYCMITQSCPVEIVDVTSQLVFVQCQ